MKITKKKLIPFLAERNLELQEYTTSANHYYYLTLKGQLFNSKYHLPEHFYTLKQVFNFLINNPRTEIEKSWYK